MHGSKLPRPTFAEELKNEIDIGVEQCFKLLESDGANIFEQVKAAATIQGASKSEPGRDAVQKANGSYRVGQLIKNNNTKYHN